MRTAFAVWNGRIAPLFDVARQIRVIESADGRIAGETRETLASDAPGQRVARLAALGVDVLICGAISRPLEAVIESSGVSVVSFVSGDSGEVIQAWLGGKLQSGPFGMPGCGRGHGRKPSRGWSGEVVCPQGARAVPRGPGPRRAERCCPHCGRPLSRPLVH
jgi:predicted Fe-Mo cluster-binding NifX family protein